MAPLMHPPGAVALLACAVSAGVVALAPTPVPARTPALGQDAPAPTPEESTPAGPLRLDQTFERLDAYSDAPRAEFEGATLKLGTGKSVRYVDPATLEGCAPPEESPRAPRAPRARIVKGDVVLEQEDAAGERLRQPLTTTEAEETEAELDPSGRFVAYVAERDLYLVPTAGGEPWRVTDDGAANYDGELDWVYQEELYGRGDFRGHWWSPDGAALAFLSLDETAVPTFTVIDHVPAKPRENRGVVAEPTRYPKAGDPNPTARVGIARPAADGAGPGELLWVDLSERDPDLLVVRVGWTPDGARLLLTIQDRIQTWAELLSVDPESGATETWIREESPTWVNRPEPPHWLSDGSFLWESERTGYRHLYRYSAAGELQGAVTHGEWQVREVLRIDEAQEAIWFEGTRESAIERHVYRVPLGGMGGGAGADDDAGLVHLTPGRGWHDVEISDDGRFLIDSWSTMELPPRARLASALDGSTLMELGAAALKTERSIAVPQRLSIDARDGYPLDASIRLPTSDPQAGPPPIFLSTYSGPDAPTVSDRFSTSAWAQFLVERGFCYLQVNVRSASNRGQVHTGTCYRQLGAQELLDLEDAVDHVVREYGADPERVAISGWSYGGFMAGYALTHSDRFALGFAGAGVHDWTLYDTIYTERYMSTPQLNPEGYERCSVIRAADQLGGHLVLFHGTMDDNVHLQNTIQLLDQLQSAGQTDFELMLYPNARHGVRSKHKRQLEWSILAREFGLDEAAGLGTPPSAESGAAEGASR